MLGIFEFIIGYFLILITWLLINVIFYALSVITKKAFVAIPYFLNSLLQIGIQLYLIFYALSIVWQVIKAKEWLIFVLILIFGSFIFAFWQMLYDFIIAPVGMITSFFVVKTEESLKKKDEDFEYEVLTPEGKVVGKYFSEQKIDKYLAKWFLVSYGLSLFYRLMFIGTDGLGIVWTLLIPMVAVLFFGSLVGVILGIINFIKRRKFIYPTGREYIARILKIYSVIYAVLLLIEFLSLFVIYE